MSCQNIFIYYYNGPFVMSAFIKDNLTDFEINDEESVWLNVT